MTVFDELVYTAKEIMATKLIIIQYSSIVYRDHGVLGFLAQKYHPKISLIFSVTVRQY